MGDEYTAYPHWFLLLVPRRPFAALLLGGVSWVGLVGLFAWLLGYFESDALAGNRLGALSTSLFFASINVYGLIAAAYVVRRSVTLLDAMPLDCSAAERDTLRGDLRAMPRRAALGVALASVACGALHTLVLVEGVGLASGDLGSVGTAMGTLLTWFVVTHMVVIFVRNARLFAAVGANHLTVDLLQPQNLRPFGQAALLPALGLLGTQLMYPLLSLEGQFNASAVLPGFVFTAVSLVYLFVHATWPVHLRIAALKRRALAELQAEVAEWRHRHGSLTGTGLAELGPLLMHRDYVERVIEWPFKLSAVVRWSLYLLIPPLTWVGAALIENLVDLVVA